MKLKRETWEIKLVWEREKAQSRRERMESGGHNTVKYQSGFHYCRRGLNVGQKWAEPAVLDSCYEKKGNVVMFSEDSLNCWAQFQHYSCLKSNRLPLGTNFVHHLLPQIDTFTIRQFVEEVQKMFKRFFKKWCLLLKTYPPPELSFSCTSEVYTCYLLPSFHMNT